MRLTVVTLALTLALTPCVSDFAQATQSVSPETVLRKYAPSALRGDRVALREAAKAITKIGPKPFRSATQMRARLRGEALRGSSAAANAYAMMLQYGIGGPARPAEAPAWYARGSLRGNVSASKNGALAYALGWGVRRNVALATRMLAKVPEPQRARMMLQISEALLRPGMEEPEPALMWLERAAALDPACELDSADVYVRLSELDPTQNATLHPRLEVMADKGNGRAALLLARQMVGTGDPDRKVDALHYYYLAANSEELDAYRELGKMIQEVPPGAAQSILSFLNIQADGGVTDARVALGRFYVFQSGLSDSARSRGMQYLRKAANDGDAETQYLLAMMLLGDPGASAQYDLARAYLVLSAENGNPQAEIAVARLGTVSPSKALQLVEEQLR